MKKSNAERIAKTIMLTDAEIITVKIWKITPKFCKKGNIFATKLVTNM
jgi:hypothetical protein